MLYLTAHNYAGALRLHPQTAQRRRLKGLPFRLGPHGSHWFPLIAALTTTSRHDQKHIHRLVEASTLLSEPLPGEPLQMADELLEWVYDNGTPEWNNRIRAIQRASAQSLAENVNSSEITRSLETIRRLIVIDPAALKYVFANGEAPLDFHNWVLRIALNHVASRNYQSLDITKELANV